MMASVICTRFGRAIDPFNPDPAQIHLDDIAWALAHQCRFTGHCTSFYSVAQHSALAAAYAWRDFDPLTAKYALLHDASEAYLADIASPVKHRPEMAFYRAAEKRLQLVIYQRFGLAAAEPAAVKHVDLRMLATEKRDLVTDVPGLVWDELPEPYPATIIPHKTPLVAYDELAGHLYRHFC